MTNDPLRVTFHFPRSCRRGWIQAQRRWIQAQRGWIQAQSTLSFFMRSSTSKTRSHSFARLHARTSSQ
eukprot:1188143-Prorocentrum_minimum.AAC.1